MSRVILDEIDEALKNLPSDSPSKTTKKDDQKGEVDELDEFYTILCQQSLWDDLVTALYDVRYIAPLIAIFAIYLGYHITIAPYRVHVERGLAHASTPLDLDLNTVRPVISPHKQFHMQRLLLNAETQLELPTFENIRFKFFTSVPEQGNFRLPQMFFQGVTFGITAVNSHNVEHTSYNTLTLLDLEEELRHSFKPVPTFVMRRNAVSNDSLWEEQGFALYYSYADLQNIGKLSSDVERPWKRILEPLLDLSRRYKQSYITVWYPRAFGAAPSETLLEKEKRRRLLEDRSSSPVSQIPAVKQAKLIQDVQLLPPRLTTKPPPPLPKTDASSKSSAQQSPKKEDVLVSTVHRPHPFQHMVLLQEILPTRTGLDGLKSSSVVWLSAVDDISPHLIDFVRLDEW